MSYTASAHVSNNWACDDDADLMGCISTFAPALTHLQFSTIDDEENCRHLRHLPAALGPVPKGASPETSVTTRLPESLRMVVVRIWTRVRWRRTTRFVASAISVGVAHRLSQLEMEDERFFFWRNEYMEEPEESRWQRRVDGGEEEWIVGKQAKVEVKLAEVNSPTPS